MDFFFLILQSFLAVISALERFATHAGGTCSFVPSVMACVIPTLCHGSWLLKNKSYKYEALWILYLHWTHSQGVSKLAHGLNFARFNWVGKVTEVNWDFYTPATQKVKKLVGTERMKGNLIRRPLIGRHLMGWRKTVPSGIATKLLGSSKQKHREPTTWGWRSEWCCVFSVREYHVNTFYVCCKGSLSSLVF